MPLYPVGAFGKSWVPTFILEPPVPLKKVLYPFSPDRLLTVLIWRSNGERLEAPERLKNYDKVNSNNVFFPFRSSIYHA